jgi:hypothetical protein
MGFLGHDPGTPLILALGPTNTGKTHRAVAVSARLRSLTAVCSGGSREIRGFVPSLAREVRFGAPSRAALRSRSATRRVRASTSASGSA